VGGVHPDGRRGRELVRRAIMGVDVRVDMELQKKNGVDMIRQVIETGMEIGITIVGIMSGVTREIDGMILIKHRKEKTDPIIAIQTTIREIGIMIRIMIGNDGEMRDEMEIVEAVVTKQVAGQVLARGLGEVPQRGKLRLREVMYKPALQA